MFTAALAGNGSRADSLLTDAGAGGVSQSVAEGRAQSGLSLLANGSSGGVFTHAFNLNAGTVITITFNAARTFDLSTDFLEEVATATSSVTATLTRTGAGGAALEGTIAGAFDINATDSVADGGDLSRSNSGAFTVTFAPVATAGAYTLNLATRTTIDALSSDNFLIVPAPAALALFGVGLIGLAAVRRRR